MAGLLHTMVPMNEISALIATITVHPYIALFLALLVGGEVALVPAIFFALGGILNLGTVIAIAVAATAVSDSAWYFLGRSVPKDRLLSLSLLRRQRSLLEKAMAVFAGRNIQFLFMSKFVYGTRIVAQVLSGFCAMRYGVYLIVDIAAALTWAVFLVGLSSIAQQGASAYLSDFKYGIQIAFLGVMLVIALLYVIIHKTIYKAWFR